MTTNFSIVIPGRREVANPESSRAGIPSGFRVRGLMPAPRNDGLGEVDR